MSMSLKQGKPRATDPFTKGGQIFGHIWRMRWQNLKLVSALSAGGGVLGLFAHASVKGLIFLDFWEFYLLDYWGGWFKIWTWPTTQKVLLLADAWLKGLMQGSKGIPSAFLSVSQLMTTVSAEITFTEMPAYRIPTVLFLEEPWVLEKASQIHICLGSGISRFLIACLGCAWFFKRQSQKLEEERILQGQELAPPEVLQRTLSTRGMASDLYLTPELSLVKDTEVEHLMVCGATRTGKTSTLLSLLIQVRAKKQKAVVLDLTGELTAKFFREGQDVLLNPLDARSESWDIFKEPLGQAEIEAWAASMIPSESHDPIWSQAARKLLSVTTHQMCEKHKKILQEASKEGAVTTSITPPTLQEILSYAWEIAQ